MTRVGFGDTTAYFEGNSVQDIMDMLKNGATVNDIFNKYGSGSHGSTGGNSNGGYGSGYGGSSGSSSSGAGYTGHPSNPFGMSGNVSSMLDRLEDAIRSDFGGANDHNKRALNDKLQNGICSFKVSDNKFL